MVHKVPPFSFRVGKTFNWETNVVTRTDSLDFIIGTAFEKLIYEICYKLGRKKRFYVVRVSEKAVYTKNPWLLMLYMPQIKRQAKYLRWGPKKYRIFRFLLRHSKIRLRKYFWKIYNRAIPLNWYRKKSRRRMNRWLTKRMFRGTWLAKKLAPKAGIVLKIPYGALSKFNPSGSFSYFLFFMKAHGFLKQKKLHRRYIKNKKVWSMIKPLARRKKKWLKRYFFLLKRYRYRIQRKLTLKKRRRWGRKKKIAFKRIRSSIRNKRRFLFNEIKFSEKVSKKLKKKIRIKACNLFVYLIKKGRISFRTHQRNYWNKKYKYQRYFYAHYYDIINAFWVIGLFDNYKILCEIFKMTIPRFSKLKRFLFFLDRVTRGMRCVTKKFACFRIRWTGKITGSTKRTKTFKLGYGVIPYQTIKKKVRSLFYSYRHMNGAFGIKFLVSYR